MAQQKIEEQRAKAEILDQKRVSLELEKKVLAKWSSDTHIIAALLKDFEREMSDFGVQLGCQSEGPQEGAIAVLKIAGRVSGREVYASFNVAPGGEVNLVRQGPKFPSVQVVFHEPPAGSVMTADKLTYEAMLMDLIENYVSNEGWV